MAIMRDSQRTDMVRNLARAADLRDEGRCGSEKAEDEFRKLLKVKVEALSSELAAAHEASLLVLQKQILQLEGALMVQAALKDRTELPPAKACGLEKSHSGTEKDSDRSSPTLAQVPRPRGVALPMPPGTVEDLRTESKETVDYEATTESHEALVTDLTQDAQEKTEKEVKASTSTKSLFESVPINSELTKGPKIGFELLPTWSKEASTTSPQGEAAVRQRMLFNKQKKQATFDIIESVDEDIALAIKSCSMEKLMIRPTGPLRGGWDLLGFSFMLFDFVFIPLQMMTSGEGGFLSITGWITRIFWTFDLMLNFFTGYQDKDRVVMRFQTVALHYLRTWFSLDLTVCMLDWLDVAIQDMSAARLGKTIKGFRLLKMARLLRMLKYSRIPDFATPLTYYFRSDFFGSLLGIVRIMVSVVFICHIMACLWYRLAREHESDDNWLQKHHYEDLDFGHAYAVSFHWALTQFCGTMEVRPWNPGERIFAILALFLNFFTAAWVISSITSSMTKLELLTVKRSADEQSLKQYLFDNGVSRKLAVRLQRSAQHALKENERNMPESSVELLRLVSEPLRMELHLERHMPHLRHHILFKYLAEDYEDTARAICHTCINRQSVISGEVIFSPGDVSSGMYFLVKGSATYVTDDGFLELCEGEWICEAILWTPWTHRGMLFAAKDCMLLCVDSVAFGKVLEEEQHAECRQLLQVYARKFVERMNGLEAEDVSDAHDDVFEVEEALKAADEENYSMGPSLLSQRNVGFRQGQRVGQRKKK